MYAWLFFFLSIPYSSACGCLLRWYVSGSSSLCLSRALSMDSTRRSSAAKSSEEEEVDTAPRRLAEVALAKRWSVARGLSLEAMPSALPSPPLLSPLDSSLPLLSPSELAVDLAEVAAAAWAWQLASSPGAGAAGPVGESSEGAGFTSGCGILLTSLLRAVVQAAPVRPSTESNAASLDWSAPCLPSSVRIRSPMRRRHSPKVNASSPPGPVPAPVLPGGAAAASPQAAASVASWPRSSPAPDADAARARPLGAGGGGTKGLEAALRDRLFFLPLSWAGGSRGRSLKTSSPTLSTAAAVLLGLLAVGGGSAGHAFAGAGPFPLGAPAMWPPPLELTTGWLVGVPPFGPRAATPGRAGSRRGARGCPPGAAKASGPAVAGEESAASLSNLSSLSSTSVVSLRT
mmetsp:Transcript_41178/g.92736  ORF Transcript_41178/g.92736 Transcript_41178/m.92736 type:complete len:402 (-) Transcript_41178:766-1971(-)